MGDTNDKKTKKIDYFDKLRFGKAIGSMKLAGISSIFTGGIEIIVVAYAFLQSIKSGSILSDGNLFTSIILLCFMLLSAYIIYNGTRLYKLPNSSAALSKTLIRSTVATAVLSMTFLPITLLIFMIVAMTRRGDYEDYLNLSRNKNIDKRQLYIIARRSDAAVTVSIVLWSIVSAIFVLAFLFSLIGMILPDQNNVHNSIRNNYYYQH